MKMLKNILSKKMSNIITNDWKVSVSSSSMTDFCIYILIKDGLHVEPFNTHQAYEGSLQKIGLNKDNWTKWFSKIIEVRQQMSSMTANTYLDKEKFLTITGMLPEPVYAWTGDKHIGDALLGEWQQYIQSDTVDNERRKRELVISPSLWNELQVYRNKIESLNIFTVDYISNILCIVRPNALLFSFGSEALDEESLQEMILHSVAQLTVIDI